MNTHASERSEIIGRKGKDTGEVWFVMPFVRPIGMRCRSFACLRFLFMSFFAIGTRCTCRMVASS